ncbi:MAG TPA: hypothetical protein VIT65_18970 [Microlunatus sp.]
MAKVLGIHEVELPGGADPAEFERRATAVLGETWPGGITFRLYKADRGLRDGMYLLLLEVDSVEVRDAVFPLGGEDPPEVVAFLEAHPTAGEVWDRLESYVPSINEGTDYVEITE